MSTLLSACKSGIKTNFIPGAILQAVAIGLVITYYTVEGTAAMLLTISSYKAEYGYWFSGMSTALFGGLLPWLFLINRGLIPKQQFWSHGLFFVGFWFYKGVEVDFLYRLQDTMFGNELTPMTITKKVVFDQFVYNLFYSCASITLLYMWKDSGFSWRKTRSQLNRKLLTIKLPSVIFSTWIIWIPTTAAVYSMPPGLRIALFNIVLCFFVLLVTTLCAETAKQHQ